MTSPTIRLEDRALEGICEPSLEELEAELLLLESLHHGTGTEASDVPLESIPRDRSLKLSFAQQRLWFMHQLDPTTPAYNMPVALRLHGRLAPSALAFALSEVVLRHEALRTVFVAPEGEPRQRVLSPRTTDLPVIDLAVLPEAAASDRELALARDQAARPFDLEQGPLLRSLLLRLGRERHTLLVTVHHIVSDGWSMEVLVREVVELYRSCCAGTPARLPSLPVQYADYAHWERERSRRDIHRPHLEYWRRRLAGAPRLLRLPTDRPRPAEQSFSGAALRRSINAGPSDRVRLVGRDHSATPFMVLLAIYQLLLHHLSGEEDLVIGTDVANRERPEFEGLIGFFVNNIALRSRIADNPTLRRYLGTVRESCLEAFAHQEVPLDRLIDELRIERSLQHAPLFQTLFVLQNVPTESVTVEGLEVRPLPVAVATSKFDLALFVRESESDFELTWIYKTSLFDPPTIRRMAAQFETLLGDALARLEAPVSELRTIDENEERNRMAQQAQRAKARFDRFKGVKPKTVKLPQKEVVERGFLADGSDFPRVFRPGVTDVDLSDWATANKPAIEDELCRHGAILFRGFGVVTVAEFERTAAAVCSELYGEYGDLPREKSAEKIYYSTPYPPDKPILFHNESSHLHRWPTKQLFYCVKAAEVGGETPIVDCREIYRALDPEVARLFEERKLMYQRNFTDGLDVSWREFYHSDDRAEVEERCRADATECEWTSDGLRTRKICRAVISHPKTGEKCLFNQIQLHHPSRLDAEVRESLLNVYGEQNLPRNVCFGDGTPIPDSLVDEITELYWRKSAAFPWQEGDVLLLDNMMVAHARNPFEGPRKLVVGMGDMIDADQI